MNVKKLNRLDNQQQRLPKGKNVQRLNVFYLMKYIVYKTTNLINGKIYVGVHRTNPDIFDGYIGCGVTKKDQKKKSKGFPKAVLKYGYENFKRETLFEYPDTVEGMFAAYKKEEEIVNLEFIKSPKTYNLALGGKFNPFNTIRKEIVQYTLDGKFIRTWSSIREAEENLNLNSISAAVTGKAKYCGNFQWKYYDENNFLETIPPVETKEKTVYQFDLQGNLLKVWKSVTEASQNFDNQHSARVAICNVCNNITRQAYGYYWSFKNKFNYIAYGTAVAKYNDSGEFIESYSTIKEAAIKNNIKTPTNICHAISGKQKRCGGFRWRYFYGNKSNIKPL